MQNGILSETINNAIIQIGDIDDTGKGRHFVSRFIKDGLVKIEGHGIVLLKKETLDASLPSMVGTPVIIQHQNVTKSNADKLRIGTISNAYFNEPDGWYYCEGIIWDEEAKDLIDKGWSVSCSYDFLAYNDEGGVENNIKYDKEFTQLNFTHLAIVDNPRYERANIVFNSKVDNDKWITIHPNGEDSKGKPLLLKDGETPKEAIDRTYGKKDNISKDYKENTSHYGKKEHQEEIISLYEGLKNPNKSEARKKEDRELLEHHLKELSKYSDTSGIHLSDEETKRENKIKEIKKELNKKQSDIKDNEAVKRGLDEETVKKQIEKLKKGKEYRINKSARLTFTGDFDNEGMPIFQDDKGYKQGYSLTNYFEEINEGQSDTKGEKKDKQLRLFNNKEKDMLLEELKKLIFKVENSKENDEMIDNEKVDKRKLIDEVAGIMKSAGCDDEDIRTAIGKMEKIGYDKSEDGSADNKKVKNEEEKKDEKKEADKKVDNEDAEDEKKVDELKKEEKEDVDNKCKNSKSSFDKINEIFNSVKQISEEKTYVSRQEKLDNAVEYFK